MFNNKIYLYSIIFSPSELLEVRSQSGVN